MTTEYICLDDNTKFKSCACKSKLKCPTCKGTNVIAFSTYIKLNVKGSHTECNTCNSKIEILRIGIPPNDIPIFHCAVTNRTLNTITTCPLNKF